MPVIEEFFEGTSSQIRDEADKIEFAVRDLRACWPSHPTADYALRVLAGVAERLRDLVGPDDNDAD